ncbi:hypothetical protein SGRIM128S_01002 [Streptomyces griseomycini]
MVDGATTASPLCTARIAASSSPGGTSLSMKPDAPAFSPEKAYSSRSKVVRISTFGGSVSAQIAAGRLHPVELGHADVHQHHVDGGGPQHLQGLDAVARLRHDLHVRLGGEHHPEPGAQQHLVVDEHRADRHRVLFRRYRCQHGAHGDVGAPV